MDDCKCNTAYFTCNSYNGIFTSCARNQNSIHKLHSCRNTLGINRTKVEEMNVTVKNRIVGEIELIFILFLWFDKKFDISASIWYVIKQAEVALRRDWTVLEF